MILHGHSLLKTRMRIGYEETNDFDILTVTDNSKGVKNKDVGKVFGLFQRQADSTLCAEFL